MRSGSRRGSIGSGQRVFLQGWTTHVLYSPTSAHYQGCRTFRARRNSPYLKECVTSGPAQEAEYSFSPSREGVKAGRKEHQNVPSAVSLIKGLASAGKSYYTASTMR